MNPAYPPIRDLVLLGGGHAHALVLRMWAMDPLPGTRLTVINPDPVAPYTGMLPGLIAGHYRRDELMIDLVRLSRFANARLILDRATGIDRDARLIHLTGRAPLPYDLAAIDIGITSDLPGLPGAMDHAVAAKPLGAYAARWEAFLARRLAYPRVSILGAGLGGVELALATAHRLQTEGAKAQVTLFDRGDSPLPDLSARARRTVLGALSALGVTLRLGANVTAVGPSSLTLSTGEEIGSDFTLTVTGARPQPWLADIGLDHVNGFLATDASLRTSDARIFASGDCATLAHDPRPKAGVFAVRAAPVLLHNLRATLSGQPLRPFKPQSDYLKLISLGTRSATAEKWGLTVTGPRLWRLKDRIDRAFMDRFGPYPAMPTPPLPSPSTQGLTAFLDQRPLCGGCGAKLGPGALSTALATLPLPQRPEVLSGHGDDAAILATPTGVQVLTTDHLRAFSHDPRLMARLAALHALGDIWAMGATPQVALAQVTLPRLGPDLQTRMLAEVMEEAAATFRAAGADIVGGHSTEGAELTIGFTVTGTAARAIPKHGAQPGDALILTKPLGSGTILAAEMAMAQPDRLMLGEVWAACIAQMSRAQATAAATLAPHAHAMTDVTGFGLAGHLLEMLDGSSCAATVRLSDIPLMPGALELASMGQASSLQPANLAAVSWRMTAPDDPRALLLTDPQTCGGLLAAVPRALAADLLDQLQSQGHDAAIIGEVAAGQPHLTVVP
ncbi:selenide, water dikinase SelD [Tabrizicola piscis]|uniref:Selenide, water dikinase SelD n=1 Tax=Tabrizicola piscis TaxID=2494374 RepID=A0A3S8U880_9RHOB|nr:selenide, water dikinase SelD [Tabrizicola piscis]AZL59768.1 selenide, water dikinase SelD [Tabrizicola piscis]